MKVIAEHPTPEMYKSGLELDCQLTRNSKISPDLSLPAEGAT